METDLEVLLTPADFAALSARDLSTAHCVVFDVLRATSTMMTAFASGASAIYPVSEVTEALQLRAAHPKALLAGERHGVRILGARLATSSAPVDFDLGNSPREFTRERVAGRDIIMTTTNGTRALLSCKGAKRVFPCAWLNLDAVAWRIRVEKVQRLFVVCAGTYEEAAYEDTVAAGALCDLLWAQFDTERISDSAHIARQIYLNAKDDILGAVELRSRNARRLLANPELRDDVAFCLRRDVMDLTAAVGSDGAVRLNQQNLT
jgi:2-phosphosulfolactate phosphatase